MSKAPSAAKSSEDDNASRRFFVTGGNRDFRYLKAAATTMQIVRFSDLEELACHAARWDRLAAGNPFRSWAWNSTWWRHYGMTSDGSDLYVLGVKDKANGWIGFAPWYVERSAIWGRTLKFLGSGEVCSEYLGVLAEAGCEEAVAHALAAWLDTACRCADRWDMAELRSVDAEDAATAMLIGALRRRGLAVHERSGPRCWRIALPPTWTDFLAAFSPSRQRKMNRAESQWLSTGRAEVHVVRTPEDLTVGQEVLIDLHQRRRASLGERGCFESNRCAAFHREAMRQLLAQNGLLLYWLAIDGRPVAAEYAMRGGRILYAYQAGMDPDRAALSPGHLSTMIGIRHAISEGYRAFDFLRGDEPYKAHWRATPRPVMEYRIAAPRWSGKTRLVLWKAGSRLKTRWKALFGTAGEQIAATAAPIHHSAGPAATTLAAATAALRDSVETHCPLSFDRCREEETVPC